MRARTTQIGDLCSTPVVYVDAGADLTSCAALMRDSHVGSVIVTRATLTGARAVGIVTDRDIVVAALAEGMQGSTPVGRIAMRPVASARDTDDILAALTVMRDKGLRRLGVIDARGDLVGVVALDDLLHAVARQIDAIVGVVDASASHEKATRPAAGGVLVREEPPLGEVF